VLQQGVRGITDLMVMPGLINLDFADVRSVMGEMGKAMMGTGEAEGDGRALEAAEKAIANPLLDGVSMKGAKGVIISITGGEDMRLMEVDEAANHIRELVDPDANIIWGSAFNDGLQGKIRVSVVATGIDNDVDATAPRTQAFTFPGRTATPPAPVSYTPPVAEPVSEPVVAAEPAPGFESFAPAEAEELAPAPEAADEDELLLSPAAEIAEEPEAAPVAAEAPAEPARPAPRVSTGGTLFERMSNLSRGSSRTAVSNDEEEDTRAGLDIPRFLNRQNNQ
jgi:cell division protein FtsZ